MSATYIGGPLDGQTTDRHRAIYHDEDGNPIKASQGDRQFCGNGRLQKFYARQLSGGQTVYLHATIFSAYMEKRREEWDALMKTRWPDFLG